MKIESKCVIENVSSDCLKNLNQNVKRMYLIQELQISKHEAPENMRQTWNCNMIIYVTHEV